MAGEDGGEVWNRSQPWNQFFLDDCAIEGLNSVPYYSVPRPDRYPFASSGTNMPPPYRVPESGLSHEIYHAVPPSSSSNFLPNQLQQEPFSNSLMMHSEEFNFVGQMDGRSSSFKRKWPSDSMAYDARTGYQMDRRSSSFKRKWPSDHMFPDGRNTAGCSSGESSYSHHIQQKPASYSGHSSWNFNMISNSQRFEHPRRDSWRNVRCRHSDTLSLDAGSTRNHSPTHFHPAGDLHGPSAERQWNHGIAFSAGSGAFTSETDPYFPASSRHFFGANNGHHSSVRCRNASFPSGAHRPIRGVGESSSYPIQRALPPWREVAGQFSPPHEVVAASSDWNGQLDPEDLHRRSISVSIGGGRHIGARSRRTRDSYGGHQSHGVMVDTHRRWMHQGFATMDRNLLYDQNRNVNNMGGGLLHDDRHQDMRLDIDNMGYEVISTHDSLLSHALIMDLMGELMQELLALGERIGNVNTGLTEDVISKCLARTICSSSMCEAQEGIDGEKCAICLESYEMGEELASLKCGHDYHFSCIKKWLEIKNNCPICKISALEA